MLLKKKTKERKAVFAPNCLGVSEGNCSFDIHVVDTWYPMMQQPACCFDYTDGVFPQNRHYFSLTSPGRGFSFSFFFLIDGNS